jgi:diadenosine tetraphosphate (Ap4A) HIT family hydrolase
MAVDATQPYDDQNVFAKILRGKSHAGGSTKTSGASLSTTSSRNRRRTLLVIPKGAYVSWDDFSAKASDAEITGFVRAVGHVAREAGLVAPGYRLLANTGTNSHQEVPHLHVHVFAGRQLGPLLARVD